jgi:hypothetical protein
MVLRILFQQKPKKYPQDMFALHKSPAPVSALCTHFPGRTGGMQKSAAYPGGASV